MSTSSADRTAGKIDWPHWLDRTPPTDRVRTSKFKVTEHEAIRDIEQEVVKRLGVDDWRLSTAAPHRKKDGRPYSNANPEDPGVVVRWSKDGEQFAVACDHYTNLRDNLRAIGLYIREKRKMENRPVATGASEFSNLRLPAGDGDVVDPPTPPHEVLGVAADENREFVIKGAFKELLTDVHPDHGGSSEELQEAKRARDSMLGGS